MNPSGNGGMTTDLDCGFGFGVSEGVGIIGFCETGFLTTCDVPFCFPERALNTFSRFSRLRYGLSFLPQKVRHSSDKSGFISVYHLQESMPKLQNF